ncbi:phosphatase PAP2/dual specificity phosphatase family protein [Aquabacterium sp. A7-Y]|uniref:phosphatase PAP2/dual specificity phosphatase family protein n=1 Tax=Aquabacterium sp. A7-Y TaxID=1349605 RepID=UPI00223E1CD9|nr:phosphatase PAP2/dual specificity phosphatase family protein [Aquabacterium sp. A7-Y]MCW7537532.1 phosphatase PAP2/dual specificity phosphatase family protein [Aquabacterium sp. A7-Y]
MARLPPLWRPGLGWLLVLGPLFFLSYGAANHYAHGLPAVPSIVFDWERHIPLWPWTILPYWSIDLFYGLSLLICRTRLELKRHALRLLTAQLISVACFVLFPLRYSVQRPPLDGWAGRLFDALAGFDLPYNQAPSLHIVLLLILWDFYRRRTRGAARAAVHGWSLLIGVSVLTTWQHHFFDVPTGLLVGLLCLWLWPLDGPRPGWDWRVDASRRRLALAYAAGAVLLALLAGGLGRPGWWLYWPAASLTLVALCYAALGADGFQKRPGGRHSLAVRWLLAPYRLGAWINSRAWTRRAPPCAAVVDEVWIGRLPRPGDPEHGRFPRIVDLSAELSIRHHGLRALPLLDLTPPAPAQLLEGAALVEQAAGQGPVLVCCALGYSRSAAVLATWLCSTGRSATPAEAAALLRRARPQVVLKPPLLAAVEAAVTLARRRA